MPPPLLRPSDHVVTTSMLDARLQRSTDMITAAVMEPICALQQEMAAMAASISRQQVNSSTAASAPAPSPPQPTPAAQPAGIAPTGESTVSRVFPFLSNNIVNLVYADRLKPSDLGKLRSNSGPSTSAQEASTFTVAGVEIAVPTPSSAAPLKTFLKAVPNALAFAQAWTVYAALRSAYSSDRTLSPALGQFLVHVIDLDQHYAWQNIAEYVLAVCKKRFGHADAETWARRDTEAFQDKLSIAIPKVNRAPAALQPSSKKGSSSAPICLRWNNASCTGPCTRLHQCLICSEDHQSKSCPHLLTSKSKVSQPSSVPASVTYSKDQLQGRRRILNGSLYAW